MSEEIPQEIVEAAARAIAGSLAVHVAGGGGLSNSAFDNAARAALAAARPMMADAEREGCIADILASRDRFIPEAETDTSEGAALWDGFTKAVAVIRARKEAP